MGGLCCAFDLFFFGLAARFMLPPRRPKLFPPHLFDLQPQALERSLALTGRAILLCSWLAQTARSELGHFKEFIVFLRFGALHLLSLVPFLETSVQTSLAIQSLNAASPNDSQTHIPLSHDILQVNKYLMSGLVVSSLDKWFMGPLPEFEMSGMADFEDLGGARASVGGSAALKAALQAAKAVLDDPSKLGWREVNITTWPVMFYFSSSSLPPCSQHAPKTCRISIATLTCWFKTSSLAFVLYLIGLQAPRDEVLFCLYHPVQSASRRWRKDCRCQS